MAVKQRENGESTMLYFVEAIQNEDTGEYGVWLEGQTFGKITFKAESQEQADKLAQALADAIWDLSDDASQHNMSDWNVKGDAVALPQRKSKP